MAWNDSGSHRATVVVQARFLQEVIVASRITRHGAVVDVQGGFCQRTNEVYVVRNED